HAERVRRERNQLRADGLTGNYCRTARIHRLAGAEGANAVGDGRSVADRHDDVFEAAADLFGDDLRQRCARALALAGGATGNRDFAAWQHSHSHALKRTEASSLNVIGKSNADKPSFIEGHSLPLPK